MSATESAFIQELFDLEVTAKAEKNKLLPRITKLCALAEVYIEETKEVKLAMLKDVEDDVLDMRGKPPPQWEVDPFLCYLKA